MSDRSVTPSRLVVRVLRPFFRALQWRLGYDDERALARLVLAFTAIALLALVAPPRAWVALMLAGVVLAAGTLLHAHHRQGELLAQLLPEAQALMALHRLLELRAPLPTLGAWAISPRFAATLYASILDRRPATVVELGSGSSSVVVGYALERLGAGRALSFDHEGRFARTTERMLAQHGVGARVEVRHAPLAERTVDGETHRWYSHPDLDAVEAIDVLVVDGPPAARRGAYARYPALPVLHARLAPDALVFVDDTDRPGEQHIVDRWIEAYGLRRVRTLSGPDFTVLTPQA